MAIPIASTPPLNAKEAKKFFRSIKADLEKPQEEIIIPDLTNAEKQIIRYALKRKK